MNTSTVVGRFAPSPSGDLHFGSLVAALGSYLSARSQQGQWLVRIEDIDPPREVPGAANRILKQLEHYGFEWDGEVLWQSQRHHAYRAALDWLITHRQSYYCTCTRKQIQSEGGFYRGHCRHLKRSSENAALRLCQHCAVTEFTDRLRGVIQCDPRLASEDFIIHRRDGLFAYNLAVVVDDHFQGVTEIVRGADLIEPTVRQLSLYQQFNWACPEYLHLPLALANNGNKLSKQNHAPPIPLTDPRPLLCQALQMLGQEIPDSWQDISQTELLSWAVSHWDEKKIPLNDTLLPADGLSAFSNCS